MDYWLEFYKRYIRAQRDAGAEAIWLGDIASVSAALKGKAAFSCNLDPLEVLWKDTPELIKRETERIISACRKNGGYIFNTGEMNPGEVPPRKHENHDGYDKTPGRILKQFHDHELSRSIKCA